MPVADDVKNWPHLHDLEFPTIDAEEGMLLIGANASEAFWVLEGRRGNRSEPCTVKSLLGWSLFGPTATVKENNIGMVYLIQRNEYQLQQQLEMFWKTDFGDSLVDDKKSMLIEDSQALKIMETTAVKVERHYQIALPWRCSPSNF